MLIGALVGAVAGVAVYGTKVALSDETKWSWKAAAAHAAGGVVGGGLFPAVLAGLAAVGIPVGVSYVLAGGLAWGGIWSLAQDSASWALGLTDGLRSPSKYAIATGVGLVATLTLMPLAARAVGGTGGLIRHAGTVESYVVPTSRVPASLAKSEAEFLAFGAMAEVADNGINRAANEVVERVIDKAERRQAEVEAPLSLPPERDEASAAGQLLGPLELTAEQTPGLPQGSFGSFLARTGNFPQPSQAPAPLLPEPGQPPLRSGLDRQLQSLSQTPR